MRMPLFAVALLCAAPVAAEPHPAAGGNGPSVLVAQLGGGGKDGLMLMPVLQFQQGRWQSLTTEAAMRLMGPSTWSSFALWDAKEADAKAVPLRTATTVKPFKVLWGDDYPGFLLHDKPTTQVSLAVTLEPKDARARAFLPPSSEPLRDALKRKVLESFPSLEKMGQQLVAQPDTRCEGAAAWKEEALTAEELDESQEQFVGCARGSADVPLVCQVRITRRMASTKAACRANVWVDAWLVGTPERFEVVRINRGVYAHDEDGAGISGERAMLLLELEGRLFALTRPICFEGCQRLSVLEVGAKGIKPLATGQVVPDEF
ncbi:hypothetical protein JYJ95_14420 [Corallococcus exiguus]|uniref:hypothetical protein n=1 Tax=Corallococcus exiguus TaxID=83462 RepID=UPI001A8E39B2|nr:hypothetical protein [Corallococcus exiguus]MBN8467711.1 hypothetical protein [Corallococcus exiguus]